MFIVIGDYTTWLGLPVCTHVGSASFNSSVFVFHIWGYVNTFGTFFSRDEHPLTTY